MTSIFQIRTATESDLPELGRIFSESIRGLGPSLYSPEQVAVWSSVPDREEYFRKYILKNTTFVADGEGGIMGFCGLSDAGRIASLYVRHDLNRKGLGSKLLCHAIDVARTKGIEQLWTEASKFSKPLFEKHGFHLERIIVVQRKGVTFEHHILRMSLFP